MKNPWVNDSVKLVNLLQVVEWVLEKTKLSWLFSQIWKETKKVAERMDWTWSKSTVFFIIALIFLLVIVFIIYSLRKKIYHGFAARTKENLARFGKSVNDVIEELKRRRGGVLNRSVLLYKAGSHKYGYERLDESKQDDIYWISRTDQADRWTNWEVVREKLVDQVRYDFNRKRDEKKIKKYFRPYHELKNKLEWVDKEMKEIMTKNPREMSEADQKRLNELLIDEKRLETELYYSEMFFIVL